MTTERKTLKIIVTCTFSNSAVIGYLAILQFINKSDISSVNKLVVNRTTNIGGSFVVLQAMSTGHHSVTVFPLKAKTGLLGTTAVYMEEVTVKKVVLRLQISKYQFSKKCSY